MSNFFVHAARRALLFALVAADQPGGESQRDQDLGTGKHHGAGLPHGQVSTYFNVVKPYFGPKWQIRVQAQLMLPK